MNISRTMRALACVLALAAAPPGAHAQEQQPTVGPVTKLPMPRYVSLRSGEVNVRRGPGLNYRIDWVFQRTGLPVRIVDEYQNWRRVADSDDAGGWVFHALLTARRTALVTDPEVALRASCQALLSEPRSRSRTTGTQTRAAAAVHRPQGSAARRRTRLALTNPAAPVTSATLSRSGTGQRPARDGVDEIGAVAREIVRSGNPLGPPACVVSGGETTVTIDGPGLGGRNQEFALAAAIEIDGLDNVVILSGGTDGTDGPTDAAGAIADGSTVKRAENLGLNPKASLAKNDSYNFFSPLGDLIITGPTNTNVMDLRLVLVR